MLSVGGQNPEKSLQEFKKAPCSASLNLATA